MNVRLTKVQIDAEFVVDEGEDSELEPGSFGPVTLTPREWAKFDLRTSIAEGVADKLDAT